MTILKPSHYKGIPDKETDAKIKQVLDKNMHGSSSIENKFLIITENVNHKELLNNNFTMLLFYENGSPYQDIDIKFVDNFYTGIVISFILIIVSITFKESIDEDLEKHLKKIYDEK